MNHGFGIASPAEHSHTPLQPPARVLIVIDSAGSRIARLFLVGQKQVGEFDAATEEVSRMTQGLVPTRGALDPAWDQALAGHTAIERAAAEVYALDA
jgi:hypothetical protein